MHIIDIITSRIHMEAWASWYEEQGGSLSQCRVEDYAPRPPVAAMAAAIAIADLAGNVTVDNADDIACAFIGSGGGSGERVPASSPRGEFHYYTGDDGAVYAFISGCGGWRSPRTGKALPSNPCVEQTVAAFNGPV